jgi:hypothetical protein
MSKFASLFLNQFQTHLIICKQRPFEEAGKPSIKDIASIESFNRIDCFC